ncbi:hypothetical protein GF420_13100 [candidate division GN15 bacterium]|nr:hypothetical protein [candidate division GN15 bacterium]
MSTETVLCRTDRTPTSIVSEVTDRHDAPSTATETSWSTEAQSSIDAIAGVILGVLLRDELIDHDRRVLDELFSENEIVFLLHGSRWLHPTDLPLFDLDLIEAAVSICGSAIVTHRYRPDESDPEGWYAVTTSVLNPGELPPIVLGTVARDLQRTAAERQERFGKLVGALRTAYPEITQVAAKASAALTVDSPVMVIDRRHETVVAVNDTARQLANGSGAELVGLTYGEAASLIHRNHHRRCLSVTRLSNDLLPLSLVRLVDCPQANRDTVLRQVRADAQSAVAELSTGIADLRDHLASRGTGAPKIIDRIEMQADRLANGLEAIIQSFENRKTNRSNQA